jgi:hypothetical protein
MYQSELSDGLWFRACDDRAELFGDQGHRLRYEGGTGSGQN